MRRIIFIAMNKDLRELYSQAMGSLIEYHTESKMFLNKEEFEANRGKVFILTGAYRNLNEKLNKDERIS